jgi:hypothetical protein
LLEQEVKPLIEQFLRERGLELSPEKTIVTHIEQGFDFLGQTIRKYRRGKRPKFFITPSKKNVKAFLRKIRTRIKESREPLCWRVDRSAQSADTWMGTLSSSREKSKRFSMPLTTLSFKRFGNGHVVDTGVNRAGG